MDSKDNREVWTSERIEELTKLWARGYSAGQIAVLMGDTSRNAVVGKVHRLGLAGRVTQVCKPRSSYGKPKPKPKSPAASHPWSAKKGKAVTQLKEPQPLRTDANAPEDIGANRKTLIELDAIDCRWPIGNPGQQDFHFCARPKVDATSYCEYHARIAFAPQMRRPGVPYLTDSVERNKLRRAS